MPNNQKQGLITKQTLINAELADIEQLTDTCNSHENLHMRLSWLRTRPPANEPNDFLYYHAGVLIGYLNISSYGTKEKELIGMVHPDHRRQGIFRALLTAATEECLRRGVQQIILICGHSSQSGLACVEAIGAHHAFSEHEMVLGTFQQKRSADERLHIRRAGANDAEVLTSIMATDFSDLEEAQHYIIDFLPRPDQPFYLALLDQEPIGCLRLDETADAVGIYGFVVRPEYRGRGYGRQLLEAVIRTIQAKRQRPITLEVETNNTNAIGLYQSCGFEIKTTYDYYELDIHW